MNDFLLNNTNDLQIISGDFVIGNNTQQNIEDVLMSANGEYKQYLNVGANLPSYQKSDVSISYLNQLIQRQLLQDRFIVNVVNTTLDPFGNLNISTNATKL